MADMIFINYRREDSAGTAGRLHDRLAQAFGRKDIFMDVDQIPPGIDFAAHLTSQVAACKAFLVVIGPHWLNVKNEAGERRLHQPETGGGSAITTDSISRCEQSCAEQQWCKAYSYNKRTGQCSLSKLASDSAPSPDVDSGVRNN
jgi:hypothetical protein